MSSIILVLGIFLFTIALPHWLPALVIRLRMFIFTKVNGEEGVQVPNKNLSSTEFDRLYSHEAARGRSKGARLSDLFWYWLSPGPEMHQEHLENGEKYDHFSNITKRILAVPAEKINQLAEKCATKFLQNLELTCL